MTLELALGFALLGAHSPLGGLAPDLAIWRKPDRNGLACASCHSPDGIDVASFDFDTKDLLRRATPHFGATDQAAVVQFLLTRRSKVAKPLLNDDLDRPFQPGGKVLEGSTPEARDARFGLELLKQYKPIFFAVSNSAAEAKSQALQVQDLDAFTVPIGIPLNRFSEDGFRGEEHATCAQWLPENGIKLVPAVLQAEDAYLANPNWDTLTALIDAVKEGSPAGTAGAVLSKAKFEADIVFQHVLRERTGLAPKEPLRFVDGNPFWQVGDIARFYQSPSFDEFFDPDEIGNEKRKGPPLKAQFRQATIPWLWLGWMFDPSLVRSGLNKQANRADYFVKLLKDEGPYPIHTLYMLTKKNVAQLQNVKLPFVIDYTSLLDEGIQSYEPRLASSKKIFDEMAASSFNLMAYLLQSDARKRKEVMFAPEQRQQVKAMRQFLLERGLPGVKNMDATLAIISKVKPVAQP